jgi:hypothetical protein
MIPTQGFGIESAGYIVSAGAVYGGLRGPSIDIFAGVVEGVVDKGAGGNDPVGRAELAGVGVGFTRLGAGADGRALAESLYLLA